MKKKSYKKTRFQKDATDFWHKKTTVKIEKCQILIASRPLNLTEIKIHLNHALVLKRIKRCSNNSIKSQLIGQNLSPELFSSVFATALLRLQFLDTQKVFPAIVGPPQGVTGASNVASVGLG